MMQWLQLNWQQLLIGFSGGVVLTALFAWLMFYLQQKKWQLNVADQLEDSIQQRTLELQITLTELADKNKQLEQQNTRDALTGVRNRAFFDQKFSAELKRSRRERSTLGLLMIDIDHFKAINDNHGHLVGDLVIKEVANGLQQELKRSTDHLCRYGGEEFAIILPNTDHEGAMILAEQLRLSLADQHIQYEELELSVTVSIGCYAAVAEINSSSADYIQAADTALYQAKNEGRNKVVCSALSQSVISEQETPDESV
ncbi:MAG: GGDEF domain-containing protein [Gammaproteobacteria bacterium]|nr:GGDEF domain-containing protein [Gammaproteobacteria bacterium]MBU2059164.1 GGDEF domain-containing protein [Gammaproteobacteria bacterium]MBU2173715.1 GGDEF domain-containing protein [Gammaproteobacteria bacterium]MBU2246871.1 GGDEF domain-containing protein [Gammaproteobacteria bacterium]MBU2343441.1 GGDEF domain-containing protein [Gammaproteobacteria bacterium]